MRNNWCAWRSLGIRLAALRMNSGSYSNGFSRYGGRLIEGDTIEAMTHLMVELIPDPELGGFTARVPDIPAYGEGETEDEAIADLKDALATYIEEFGLDE